MEPLQIIGAVFLFGSFFIGIGVMYYKFDKRMKEIQKERDEAERELRAH